MPRTKLSLIFFLAAFLLTGSILRGQEPPLPAATDAPSPSASARPQLNIPEIPMAVEPPPLVPAPQIPSSAPNSKKPVPPLSELDAAFQKTPLGQASEEYRLHVEWRQLQNRASLDPEVIAAKAEIKNARTDLEKREYQRAYYRIFYARMQSLASAPDVKAYLEGKKKAVLDSLSQPRVHPEPTVQPRPGH